MSESDCETDFAAWADAHALALRDHVAGGNRPVDWAHVIAEIEGLAASDRRQLRNRVRMVMEHLLKLQSSKDAAPRRGWEQTIDQQRSQLETLLRENRSLRRAVPTYVAEEIGGARKLAFASMARFGDAGTIERGATFTPDQVLDDWFPS